jgi:phosphate starvation-inducible membrane PsiE
MFSFVRVALVMVSLHSIEDLTKTKTQACNTVFFFLYFSFISVLSSQFYRNYNFPKFMTQ